MKNQGVEEWAIGTVKNLYKNSKAYMRLEKKGKEFQIRRGLRQGHPLSPNLFNCILERFFEQRGMKVNGEYINN